MLEKLLLAVTVTLGLNLVWGVHPSTNSDQALSSRLGKTSSPLLELLAQSWR